MYSELKTTTCRLRLAFIAVVTTGLMAIPAMTHAMDWYGGLGYGQSGHEATGGDLLGSGFSGSVDGNDSGWKALAGMALWDKYVAAEFGYVNLGKASAKGTKSGSAVTATSEGKGYTAAIAGLIPFGDRFGLVLKIGAIGAQVFVATTGATAPTSRHSSDLSPFAGIGVQYDFSKKMGVRFEAERYNMASLGSPYVNLLSAGLIYRFGK